MTQSEVCRAQLECTGTAGAGAQASAACCMRAQRWCGSSECCACTDIQGGRVSGHVNTGKSEPYTHHRYATCTGLQYFSICDHSDGAAPQNAGYLVFMQRYRKQKGNRRQSCAACVLCKHGGEDHVASACHKHALDAI